MLFALCHLPKITRFFAILVLFWYFYTFGKILITWSTYNNSHQFIFWVKLKEFFTILSFRTSVSPAFCIPNLMMNSSSFRRRSWETRARIVMEKTHFWPRLVEPMAFLQPPAEAGPPAQAWQHCGSDGDGVGMEQNSLHFFLGRTKEY